MKTVGKQLQEARLAKNWTPELAARETKIKVERVRDLEADDYSNFTSPTYARGFVRTYARALGLDEYRVLRQLDNKLPDDDSANIVTDTGIAYLPETAMPPRAAHRDYTGLYVVMALGGVILMITSFVLFEAYRAGELASWFSSGSESVASTTASTNAAPDTARALPVDSNTPPPIADAVTNAPAVAADTNAPAATVANIPGVSPRAQAVDLSQLGNAPATTPAPAPTAPSSTDIPVNAPRALPVDLSQLSHEAAATPPPAPTPSPSPSPSPVVTTAPDNTPVPPRALPVDPAELANPPATTPAPSTLVAANTVPTRSSSGPTIGSSGNNGNNGPVVMPPTPSVEPATAPTVTPPSDPAPTPTATNTEKRLVLTAWKDSFVRVTNIDEPDEKPLYASVLHSGQSVGFDGRKFSVNVSVPSAVNIQLDGVNYGPHSDQEQPETFTVQSHLP